jgi:hypothetical protein
MGSNSTSFIFSRRRDIRKHVVGVGNALLRQQRTKPRGVWYEHQTADRRALQIFRQRAVDAA